MSQESHWPVEASAPWRWRAMEPALPALPPGELTLVELGLDGPSTWLPVVLPLVTDTLGDGRAVLYVVAGGDANRNTSCDVLCQTIVDPMLAGATDFTVHGCSPLGQGWYGPGAWMRLDQEEPGYDPSYIPTVHDMADARAVHEQRNGRALLIVNDVQWVRPVEEDGLREVDRAATLSGRSFPSNHQRHLARARDLVCLAGAQPQAPTVVMWTGADHRNHGLAAILAYALAWVQASVDAGALHLSITTRASIGDAWSAPSQLQRDVGPDLLTFWLGEENRAALLREFEEHKEHQSDD